MPCEKNVIVLGSSQGLGAALRKALWHGEILNFVTNIDESISLEEFLSSVPRSTPSPSSIFAIRLSPTLLLDWDNEPTLCLLQGDTDVLIINPPDTPPQVPCTPFGNVGYFRAVTKLFHMSMFKEGALIIYVSNDSSHTTAPRNSRAASAILPSFPAFNTGTDKYLQKVQKANPNFKILTVHFEVVVPGGQEFPKPLEILL
jgi:hypothetical protein